MARRRRIGVALSLILVLQCSLAAPSFSLSTKEVRQILQESKGDDPPALEGLVGRLEPMDPVTVAALRIALLDRDPFIRATSVRVIGAIGDPSPKSMARLLDDPDGEVRTAAAAALAMIGEPCVGHLNELLAEPGTRRETRQRVATILGEIGHPDSVLPLTDFLLANRKGGPVSDNVLKALAGIGAPSVGSLLGLLKYKPLEGDIYLILFEMDRTELTESLLNVLRDSGNEPTIRILAAEKAVEFLGSEPVRDELVAFYQSDEAASFPTDQKSRMKNNEKRLLSAVGNGALQPWTRKGIMTKLKYLKVRAASLEVWETEQEAKERARKSAERARTDEARRQKEDQQPNPSGLTPIPRGALNNERKQNARPYQTNEDYQECIVKEMKDARENYRRDLERLRKRTGGYNQAGNISIDRYTALGRNGKVYERSEPMAKRDHSRLQERINEEQQELLEELNDKIIGIQEDCAS